jgi:hypothetical protein
MLGADVTFYGTAKYTCSGAKPLIASKDDLHKLKIDPDNYWVKFIQEALRHCIELSDDKMVLIPIISMDALNLAVELMGTTEAYTAIYDEDSVVFDVMEFGIEYNAYLYKIQNDIIRPYNDRIIKKAAQNADSSPYGGLLLSVDAYTICNPDIYEEMGFNYQQRLIDKVGYAYLHMHGTLLDGLLPLTSKLKGVTDYRLGRDLKAGVDLPFESVVWMREVLGDDKQFTIGVSKNEFIDGIKNRTLPFNVHYQSGAGSVEEAEMMVEMARNYKR